MAHHRIISSLRQAQPTPYPRAVVLAINLGKSLEPFLHHLPGEQQGEGLLQHLQILPTNCRLTTVGIQTGLVEIGRSEGRIPTVEEGKRPVVEAFANQRHVVGVEHPMDEARRHPLSR